MRLRSCRTDEKILVLDNQAVTKCMGGKLTGDAGEELSCKLLNVTAGERNKLVALQEVKDALAEQVGDDANMIPKVKGVSEMDAFVAVLLVIL